VTRIRVAYIFQRSNFSHTPTQWHRHMIVIGPAVAIKPMFVTLLYLAEVLLFPPHTSLVNSDDDYLFQKIAPWPIERMVTIIPKQFFVWQQYICSY